MDEVGRALLEGRQVEGGLVAVERRRRIDLEELLAGAELPAVGFAQSR